MVFIEGVKTGGDTYSDGFATIFKATEKIKITKLETKVQYTGASTFIDLVVKGVTVRTVHYTNPDSSYVTTSQGVELDVGQTIQFVRENPENKRFNAKCFYKLTYELVVSQPLIAIGDVSVSIQNASATNSLVVFDVNYSAQAIAVGIQGQLTYNIKTVDNLPLAVKQVSVTIQSSGIHHFEVPIITTANQILIQVSMFDNNFNPLSFQFDRGVTLQVTPPPEPEPEPEPEP